MTEKIPSIVTVQWLKSNIDNPNVAVLDATWHLPDSDLDAEMDFKDGHIPGAQFFDIPAFSDQNTDLPNMLPPPDQFAQMVSAMGIGNDDHVIVYDTHGIFSAPRAWWMFRYFGHNKISVLDGGFPAWLAQNNPVQTGRGKAKKTAAFVAKINSDLLKNFDDMKNNVESKSAAVIDMRSKERFDGITMEPWGGERGHIPGSKNWYYKNLLQPNHRIKDVEILKQDLTAMGIKFDRPIITTCGSGISACIGALALHIAGVDAAVYDGSFAEWSRKSK